MSPIGIDLFAQCGWPAYATVGVAAVSVVLAVVALAMVLMRVRLGRLVALLALAAAFAPYGMGLLGTSLGRRAVDQAVASLDPASATELRAQGYAEAGRCIDIGMGGAMLPLLLSAVAVIAGAVRSVGRRDATIPQSAADGTAPPDGAA